MQYSGESIEDKLKAILAKAKSDDDVLAVLLYGSSARGETYRYSDVDICIIMDENNYTSIQMFHKLMSYLKLADIDIKIFQQLPLYIKIRVIKEGKVLFCKNEDKLYEVVFKNMRDFADFERAYNYYLEEVSNAG